MIVEQNKLSLNLMCFEFPQKLDIRVLQRHMLPRWSEFLVRAVNTVLTLASYYHSLDLLLAWYLGLCWYITQYME